MSRTDLKSVAWAPRPGGDTADVIVRDGMLLDVADRAKREMSMVILNNAASRGQRRALAATGWISTWRSGIFKKGRRRIVAKVPAAADGGAVDSGILLGFDLPAGMRLEARVVEEMIATACRHAGWEVEARASRLAARSIELASRPGCLGNAT